MNQNQVFTLGEADEFYKRNRLRINSIDRSLQAEDVHYICKTLWPFNHQIKNVLEIGCSSGIKLEAICRHFNATGKGVEPSAAAVLEGNSRIASDNIKDSPTRFSYVVPSYEAMISDMEKQQGRVA